jgi:hypothetical protein
LKATEPTHNLEIIMNSNQKSGSTGTSSKSDDTSANRSSSAGNASSKNEGSSKQSGSGGTQGGTHEQHVEAGRQSHKNDR